MFQNASVAETIVIVAQTHGWNNTCAATMAAIQPSKLVEAPWPPLQGSLRNRQENTQTKFFVPLVRGSQAKKVPKLASDPILDEIQITMGHERRRYHVFSCA